MARNTLSRSLHDVGLAAWFGGTLANAVALNPAAGEAGSASDAGRVANAGGTGGRRSTPRPSARTWSGASANCSPTAGDWPSSRALRP
jgi:hypothetical protein